MYVHIYVHIYIYIYVYIIQEVLGLECGVRCWEVAGYQPSRVSTPPLTHSCWSYLLVWLFPTVCVSSKIHCLICTTMGCVRFGRWVGINPSLTHSSRPSVPRCVVRTNGVFDHTRERVDCVDS